MVVHNFYDLCYLYLVSVLLKHQPERMGEVEGILIFSVSGQPVTASDSVFQHGFNIVDRLQFFDSLMQFLSCQNTVFLFGGTDVGTRPFYAIVLILNFHITIRSLMLMTSMRIIAYVKENVNNKKGE